MDELIFLRNNSPKAIAPHYDGVHSSIIITDAHILHSTCSVNEILSKYCLMFGSSLEGRKEATRKQLGFKKNPPILISELEKIVAVQLPSQIKGDNIWIFDLDFQIIEENTNTCLINLKNKITFTIPLSKEAIKRRKMRAIELLYNFLIR